MLQNEFPLEIKPFVCLENNAQRQRGQRYDGDLTFIQWSNDNLVFAFIPNTSNRPGSLASGSVITTASLDGNIRGQQHTTITGEVLRPDLVLKGSLTLFGDSAGIHRLFFAAHSKFRDLEAVGGQRAGKTRMGTQKQCTR